ncbi:hypothetical protein QOT17_018781 [Balamuthia mandrillaris]
MKAIIGLLFVLTAFALAYSAMNALSTISPNTAIIPQKSAGITEKDSSEGSCDCFCTCLQCNGCLKHNITKYSANNNNNNNITKHSANRATESYVKLACNTLNKLINASASSTQKHSSNIKAQHDSFKPLCEFTTGPKVMLYKPPRSSKSLPEYSGSYIAIHCNCDGAYLLQDSASVTFSDKFSPN